MRLIHVDTLELEEFIGTNVPPYAILSHRWGSEELNFKEVSKDRVNRSKAGYSKMSAACRIASSEHGLQWLWIDTCCIDKRSSAELSEAINSMYRWYEQAEVCIVFLQDVEQNIPRSNIKSLFEPTSMSDTVSFENSAWFSRAWTLQELLAPDGVYFYDRRWTLLGTKVTMESRISASTKIPRSALLKEKKWAEYPIARKMFWASRRNATREEDLAYSLLGLFDVNMPLLYGEGKKAFIRLQEEIMRVSPDRSILVWGIDAQESGLLASSPSKFSDLPEDIKFQELQSNTAFVLNNLGLEIYLELYQCHVFDQYENEIARWIDGSTASVFFCYILVLELEPNSDRLVKKGILKREQPPKDPTEAIIRKCLIGRVPPTSLRSTDLTHYFWISRNLKRTAPSQDDWDLLTLNGTSTNTWLQDYCKDIECLSLMPIAYRHDWWWHKFSEGQELSKFSPSSSSDVIELSYTRANGHKIWFRIFFDFDFYPCVHIDKGCLNEHFGLSDPWDKFGNWVDVSRWLKSEGFEWKELRGYRYSILPRWRSQCTSVVYRSERRFELDVVFLSNSQGSIAPSLPYPKDRNHEPNSQKYRFGLIREQPYQGPQRWKISLSLESQSVSPAQPQPTPIHLLKKMYDSVR